MSGKPILVWDLPTRAFHWMLALCFAGAFATGDSERWRDLHVMFGYSMLILIAFRILWGFAGTRYARFASFAFGPERVSRYLRSLLGNRPEHHVGHNPAGSWAIWLLLALALAAGLTGYAAYNELGGEWLEELHEGTANAMLAVVLAHVAGVIVSSLRHHENLVAGMITGRKTGVPADGIARTRPLVAALLVAAIIGFWTFGKPYVMPADEPVASARAPAGHENRHERD